MDERKVSTILAMVGALLLVVAATAFLFVPLGSSSTMTMSSDGTTVTTEERSSLWESDHDAGVTVAAIAVGFGVVAVGLIRYGRIPGAIVVALCCSLGVLASILSVGIFLMPGAGLLVAASAISVAGSVRRAQERRLPPPPRSVLST